MEHQVYDFTAVRDVIMGRIGIPADKATLIADVDDRIAAEDALEDDYACIRYQGAYTGELIAETDYPSFDIDGANDAFFRWKKHKKADIMTFRNNSYRSVITGTMAPAHHTPWKDALVADGGGHDHSRLRAGLGAIQR